MTTEAKIKETIQHTVDAFEFTRSTKGLEGLDAFLEKVPSSKEAAMLCIHLIASWQLKDAACDHHSVDQDWLRVLAIMWKHFPEFSTNLETGERFL